MIIMTELKTQFYQVKTVGIFQKKKINDWEFCENDKKNIELLTDGNY